MSSPARKGKCAHRGGYAQIYDAARAARLKQGRDSTSRVHAISARGAFQQAQHDQQQGAPALDVAEGQACTDMASPTMTQRAASRTEPSADSAGVVPSTASASRELVMSQAEHGELASPAELPARDGGKHDAGACGAQSGASLARSHSEAAGSAQPTARASVISGLSRPGSRTHSDRAVEEMLLSFLQRRAAKARAAKWGVMGKLLSCFTGSQPLSEAPSALPMRGHKGISPLVTQSSAGACTEQASDSWRIPSHTQVQLA